MHVAVFHQREMRVDAFGGKGPRQRLIDRDILRRCFGLPSLPPEEIENNVVEPARLLPGHGVTCIMDDGPFVIS
jgi:hypothetical protein